jgi:hypothetical protein
MRFPGNAKKNSNFETMIPLRPTEPSTLCSYAWLCGVLIANSLSWIPMLIVYVLEHLIDPFDAMIPFAIVWAWTLIFVLSISALYSVAKAKLFSILSTYLTIAFIARSMLLESYFEPRDPTTIAEFTTSFIIPESATDAVCMFLGVLLSFTTFANSGSDLLVGGGMTGIIFGSFIALSASLKELKEPAFDLDTRFIIVTSISSFVKMTLYGAIATMSSVFVVRFKTGKDDRSFLMHMYAIVVPFSLLLLYWITVSISDGADGDDELLLLLPVPVYLGIILSTVIKVRSLFQESDSYTSLEDISK